MKVCPECGKVIGFNSYFGAYICDGCGWEDDAYNQERILYLSQKIIIKPAKFKILYSSINKSKCINKKLPSDR
ncbi:MAG: hypothetical protein NC320_06425 [Clostridium sp.]|nr:hypothetical protein [Clostridium sp.]MCM1547644.1 hypothetical protein [Ruminococcus sp.]